jgi:hypothetical protein
MNLLMNMPAPALDPSLYLFSNSLAVVAVAGFVFFTMGLCFGYLTWGRYQRRARAFQEETDLLRHEIASLKRRIAEEATKPASPVQLEDESVELLPPVFSREVMGLPRIVVEEPLPATTEPAQKTAPKPI